MQRIRFAVVNARGRTLFVLDSEELARRLVDGVRAMGQFVRLELVVVQEKPTKSE